MSYIESVLFEMVSLSVMFRLRDFYHTMHNLLCLLHEYVLIYLAKFFWIFIENQSFNDSHI